MFHLGGQMCVECGAEILPTTRYHVLPGRDGKNVDFVCEEHCPICTSGDVR